MNRPIFDGVLGQARVSKTLTDAFDRDRVASAYLFDGPSGVGKELTALKLAAACVAQGNPEIQQRIQTGNHPDVRIFRPRDEGHRNIQVEFLRDEVLPVCHHAPFEADRAFLIFPEADISFPHNHPGAANAILKPLEEPRPGVTFILTATRPDRLLPTIRSRCQRIRFSRLSDAVIDGLLQERGVSEDARMVCIQLASGSADRAIELAEGDLARELFDFALRIDAAVDGRRPGSLVDLADELGKSERRGLLLDTLHAFYRDVAAAGSGIEESGWGFRHEANAIQNRAETLSPGRAAARAALLRENMVILETNANPTLAMDALLFQLRDAR